MEISISRDRKQFCSSRVFYLYCVTLTLAIGFSNTAHAAIIPSGDVTPVYDNTDPWDPAGGFLVVGGTALGTLEINSGSSVNSLISAVGNQTAGDGVLTVSGANSTHTVSALLSVAGSGTGELRVENGGLVAAGSVAMAGGGTALSTATITGTDSVLDASGIIVVGGAINPFNGDIGPGGDATLNVNSGGAVTIGDTAAPVGSSLVISDMDASGEAGGALTVFSGGRVNLAGATVIGQDAGEFGWATFIGDGALLDTENDVNVGESGTGTISFEAGADFDTTGSVFIGLNEDSTGTATATGSGTTANIEDDLFVGFFGDGTLDILDGAVVQTGLNSTIGSQETSTGAVTVSGAGSHWVTDYAFLEPGDPIIINDGLKIGNLGSGDLTIEEGGLVSSGVVDMGVATGSSGNATVTGDESQWDIDGTLTVGGSGSATLYIDDGGVVNNLTSSTNIGSADGEGSVTVNGGGSQWNSGNSMFIGYGGNGTLNIEDGGVVTGDANAVLGFTSDGVGVVNIIGTGSRWNIEDSGTSLGAGGDGTLTVEDGGVASLQLLSIGNAAGGSGVVTVRDANSLVRIDNGLAVGGNAFSGMAGGTGTLNIESGGRVRLNDTNSESTFVGLDISGDGPMPMDGVTMTVYAGGTINNETNASIGSNAGEYGTAIVTGAGATWNNGSYLEVGLLGTGTLTIEAGGVVNSTDGLLGNFVGGTGNATVTGAGSRWDMTGDLDVGPTGTGTLTIETGGVVSVAGTSTIGANGTVDLTGGRFEFGMMSPADFGEINGVAGALAGVVDTEAVFFGVNDTDELEDVDFLSGFANIAPAVDLSEVTFSAYSNSGLILGNGASNLEITNNDSGSLVASSFERMRFEANGINNGLYAIQVGEISFGGRVTNNASINLSNNTIDIGRLIVDEDLDNESTGTIRGEGSIRVGGTFTNRGAMNLNEEGMEIRGAFVNDTGGSVLTTGGGTTTFFDSAVHNGDPIETGTGSSTVFRGDYSGAGAFAGVGLVQFEGPVNLGNSTAEVAFGGDVSMTDTATTTVEIGGLLAGEFDRFDIAGDLDVDGLLDVSLIDGFQLALYQQFMIADVAGESTGQFIGLDEDALVGVFDGMEVFITYDAGDGNDIALYTPGLAGDFDVDGDVDGFDFLTWQRDPSIGTLSDWQTNYGMSFAPPMNAATVPEPTAAVILGIAIGLVATMRPT